MKKFKLFYVILIVVIIILFLGWLLFFPPRVKFGERRSVSNYVEKYLTKKYGEHKFKVTKVDYDFQMSTLFDYSEPVGYDVRFKSNVLKNSYIHISGLKPDDFLITSDSFIADYYFSNLDVYDQYEVMKSITPVKEIEMNLLDKIRLEFDSNIETLKCNGSKLNLPNDFGRIPILDEIKNDSTYYEVLDFTFTLTGDIADEDDYKDKLVKYLNNTFGGDWSVYFNPNGSITCIK